MKLIFHFFQGPQIHETSTGSVQSWPKEYFFVVLDISAAELLNTFFYPAAEELQNYLQMPCFIVLQTCNRDAADLLQRCCRPTAALLQRSCRITCRCYIPNLKSLGQVFVLECCRPAAVLLQRCCRPADALLQRSFRIQYRYYIPNLKCLGQVYVLQCCRPVADQWQ